MQGTVLSTLQLILITVLQINILILKIMIKK